MSTKLRSSSYQHFDLVIFDCDGVLVDSERLANEIFRDILNSDYNLSLSLQDMFDNFVGHSGAQCLKILKDRFNREPKSGLHERYEKEINQALKQRVVAVDGIHSVLSGLAAPWCVASSGSHEKMAITLGKTGILEKLQYPLTSASEVKQGKPAPDVFLRAAEKLNITPSRCLIIEDSPPGVRAGIAAGMTVFGYCELQKPQNLIEAGAHHTFNSMSNLLADIKNWPNVSFYLSQRR